MIPLGTYKHTKTGRLYEVTAVASNQTNDSRDGDVIVVYRALYDIPELEKDFGMRPTFTRALAEFTEEVEYNGKKVKRFKFVNESSA